ncbi:hypothetical protein, partial [Streptomyces sp. C10-9-1]|uniref:hypothetical protein n=1 Tax=Streptomyces sp. C10-9-1 TaxID=1859285 RepID=UPI003D761370
MSIASPRPAFGSWSSCSGSAGSVYVKDFMLVRGLVRLRARVVPVQQHTGRPVRMDGAEGGPTSENAGRSVGLGSYIQWMTSADQILTLVRT